MSVLLFPFHFVAAVHFSLLLCSLLFPLCSLLFIIVVLPVLLSFACILDVSRVLLFRLSGSFPFLRYRPFLSVWSLPLPRFAGSIVVVSLLSLSLPSFSPHLLVILLAELLWPCPFLFHELCCPSFFLSDGSFPSSISCPYKKPTSAPCAA